MALFVYQIRRWINENREQQRKVISPAMQQKKTGLRRDRHPNLVVYFQPGTTFETFFGEKHLNVVEKFSLVRSREPDKERNSVLDDLQPLVRKRPRSQPVSASFFQEPKDHNSKSNARSESKPQIDTDFHRLGTKLFYCCRKSVFSVDENAVAFLGSRLRVIHVRTSSGGIA